MTPSLEQIIESIQQLPDSEREKVRQWLEGLRTPKGTEKATVANGDRSGKSLQWLADNREKYLGQWVALDGDRLISSGKTAKEVYAKAQAEGVKIPFVELVLEAEPTPYSGGWL